MMSVPPSQKLPPGTVDAPPGRLASAWLLPALMLALVTLSGAVVSLSWEGSNVWRFALVAFLAGLTSAILARSRLLDGLSVLITSLIGVSVIWTLTAVFAGQLDGTIWQRIRGLYQPLADALLRDDVTGINRDLTAETLLSLTIWMSSWIAMWMLLRVGYVVLALVPPVVLILANEHFTAAERAWPIIVMIVLCILIVTRHHIYSQKQRWNGQRLAMSDSIVTKAIMSGTAIAVVVASTLVISPAAWSESVLQPVMRSAIERFDAARLEVEYWFDDVLGTDLAPAATSRYTDFADGFSVGGPLFLTDQPEVLAQVQSESAPYLTARSYDHYTGRGWTSSAVGDFADGQQSSRQSPELLYNPNWEVALSDEARNERETTSTTITMLGPASDTVLSVDSFLTSNVQTVVRMGWTDVRDLPLDLSPEVLNMLPPDVQLLGSLLLQSELSGPPSSWGQTATSGEMQAAIDAEVDDLARRGIEVRWAVSSDGIVQTLYVSGRLPVFDDVEAVFRRQIGVSPTASYTVRSLTSTATPDQLIAADGEYPVWVTERYLQTGTTLTDRTSALTRDIIGDETNPYQQAVLIEHWLRSNIVYDQNVEAPPGQQDLVDYVLFDHRRGYCEHYSAAMTVMLRDLGIPARVVVGYAPGQYDPETGAWLYLQSNAHAWVEAWFPGYGWIPFEPTASQPLGEFGVESLAGEDAEDSVLPTPEPLMPTADIATPDIARDNTAATPQPTEADQTAAPPTVIPPTSGSSLSGWVLPIVAAAGAITLLGGGTWWLWQRGLRGLSTSAALMQRVRRIGGWLGIRAKITTTPREFAQQFDEVASPLAGPVKRITRAYEIDTFGATSARNEMLNDARQAWQEIRGKVLYLLRHRRR